MPAPSLVPSSPPHPCLPLHPLSLLPLVPSFLSLTPSSPPHLRFRLLNPPQLRRPPLSLDPSSQPHLRFQGLSLNPHLLLPFASGPVPGAHWNMYHGSLDDLDCSALSWNGSTLTIEDTILNVSQLSRMLLVSSSSSSLSFSSSFSSASSSS